MNDPRQEAMRRVRDAQRPAPGQAPAGVTVVCDLYSLLNPVNPGCSALPVCFLRTCVCNCVYPLIVGLVQGSSAQQGLTS